MLYPNPYDIKARTMRTLDDLRVMIEPLTDRDQLESADGMLSDALWTLTHELRSVKMSTRRDSGIVSPDVALAIASGSRRIS